MGLLCLIASPVVWDRVSHLLLIVRPSGSPQDRADAAGDVSVSDSNGVQ